MECKALGGTFSQMVSLSILGILHYVKNDVPLIMSHLVPVPPRPIKKWGLCPTNSGFVHAHKFSAMHIYSLHNTWNCHEIQLLLSALAHFGNNAFHRPKKVCKLSENKSRRPIYLYLCVKTSGSRCNQMVLSKNCFRTYGHNIQPNFFGGRLNQIKRFGNFSFFILSLFCNMTSCIFCFSILTLYRSHCLFFNDLIWEKKFSSSEAYRKVIRILSNRSEHIQKTLHLLKHQQGSCRYLLVLRSYSYPGKLSPLHWSKESTLFKNDVCRIFLPFNKFNVNWLYCRQTLTSLDVIRWTLQNMPPICKICRNHPPIRLFFQKRPTSQSDWVLRQRGMFSQFQFEISFTAKLHAL